MARGYSRDLRERLLQALASGLSAVEIARTTGVSLGSLRRWKVKQAAGLALSPAPRPADRASSRRTTKRRAPVHLVRRTGGYESGASRAFVGRFRGP